MQKIRKIAEGILLGSFFFLLFVLFFQHLIVLPSWLRVAGRMHPMFLHFPIVLLFISLLSWWILPARQFKGWPDTILLVAALSAVITALMGLLLSMEELREGRAFQWHKWSGISIAAIAVASYYLYPYLITKPVAGKTFSLLSCFLIIVAGHYGATLTHGTNYLMAPMAAENKVPVDKAVIYEDVIKPVLAVKCFTCHGEDNTKGGLSLETVAGLMNGGKTGPLFVKGDPGMSLLIHRILLPPNEKKHMPPISRPQLSEEESQLLTYWIRSGAHTTNKVVSLPVQDSFRILASLYLRGGEAGFDEPAYTFAAADAAKIASLNTNSRVIEQLGSSSPALSVHFYGKENFTPQSLKDLLDLRLQITEISLSKIPVTDKDLEVLTDMPNLNRVNLNYTPVTDEGLKKLYTLKNLQSLSVSGTRISSEAVARFCAMPQMKSVYIWNTPIDSLQVVALRKKYGKLLIESGFKDDGRTMVSLPPPRFETPGGIIEQPAQIALKHAVKGTQIRYTLDGTVPDSLLSPIYKQPVTISQNTVFTAKAFKDGWYSSREVKASYLKKGNAPDSIFLLSPPDPRYNNGAKILSDGDLGDLTYGNGQWLGYQKNNAEFELLYNKPAMIQSVILNMLENTGAQIFPAIKIEIWGGETGKLKLLGMIKPVVPEKNIPSTLIMEKITFPQTRVERLKIIVHHLASLPSWHAAKEKPAWVFVSEILVN